MQHSMENMETMDKKRFTVLGILYWSTPFGCEAAKLTMYPQKTIPRS
jgi:hypothetical protein